MVGPGPPRHSRARWRPRPEPRRPGPTSRPDHLRHRRRRLSQSGRGPRRRVAHHAAQRPHLQRFIDQRPSPAWALALRSLELAIATSRSNVSSTPAGVYRENKASWASGHLPSASTQSRAIRFVVDDLLARGTFKRASERAVAGKLYGAQEAAHHLARHAIVELPHIAGHIGGVVATSPGPTRGWAQFVG